MAHPSLRERYGPLHVVPPALLEGCYRGRTQLVLALLAKNPSGVNVGRLDVRARMVKLSPSIQWPEHNGGARRVPFREVTAVVTSIGNRLKRLGLPVGVWINGPTWDGGKYRPGPVSVWVGLVDRRAPIEPGAPHGRGRR